MHAMLERKTVVVDGESLEMWAPPVSDFSCLPDDLRTYMMRGRWDLVFQTRSAIWRTRFRRGSRLSARHAAGRSR